MKVKRIVSNIQSADPHVAETFYGKLLGLEIVMDHGWILTYGGAAEMSVQISFASEGGSGTAVPDLSIEVDDVEEAYSRMKDAGFEIIYPIATEPWGVRRFFVRDPFGKVVNILSHT